MEVELYQTEAGDEVVAEFLASLPHKDMAKVLRDIDLLAEFGTDLRQPYTKHIDGPIWELRTKFSSNIYRIFYFVKNESRLVLLHDLPRRLLKRRRLKSGSQRPDSRIMKKGIPDCRQLVWRRGQKGFSG